MVTTLYLIRHGETEGSAAKRYHGSIDIGLSEKGIRQIRHASDFIAGHLQNPAESKYGSYLRDIHKNGKETHHPGNAAEKQVLSSVYTSTLLRAVKSAEIIAAPHQLRPREKHDFRERSFGIWEGMTFIEIKEQYPDEFGAWAGNPLIYSPPGGENTLEVRDRVIAELEKILGSHRGENIALVAHGGVNRIVLCHILGIPLENIFRIEQDYAAINIIEFWDKYPVVKLMNFRHNI